MGVHVLPQPVEQPPEVAGGDLPIEPRQVRLCGVHHVGCKQIAERVGRKIPDEPGGPVDVLQHALGVGRRPDTEVDFEALVPCVAEIGDCQRALHHRAFQIESQHHVQVVGDLVGLDANERRRHGHQGPLHLVGSRAGERSGKSIAGYGEAPLPESGRPAHKILPQARLRFVDAERRRLAGRQPVPVARQALLVQPMPRFVEHAIERRRKKVLVPPRGDPAIVGAHRRAEGMRRGVEAAALEIEADALGHPPHEQALIGHRTCTPQQAVIGTLSGVDAGPHERHDLAAQPVEPRGDRRP